MDEYEYSNGGDNPEVVEKIIKTEEVECEEGEKGTPYSSGKPTRIIVRARITHD